MNKEERIQYVLDSIKDNIAVNIALSLVEECDELQQENKELKEELEKANDTLDSHNEMIEHLQKENNELLLNIIIMEKYFELISALGFDYDGNNTIESLKCLIDELCRLSNLGRVCNITETIFVNDNKVYNILHEEILKGE